MKRESGPKAAPQATAAKQQTWGHLSLAGRQALQLRLPVESPGEPAGADIWIPNHRLHPAEADLRFTVNTMDRVRPHWWLFTDEGKAQRELLERLGWWAA